MRTYEELLRNPNIPASVKRHLEPPKNLQGTLTPQQIAALVGNLK